MFVPKGDDAVNLEFDYVPKDRFELVAWVIFPKNDATPESKQNLAIIVVPQPIQIDI